MFELNTEDLAVCPSCGERMPSRAKFCMECGARMTLDSGERRTVSVLFADLSGFTSFSETVDPETVSAVAQETATRLGDIVMRYGGTVDKVIGDCVMAIFGAPVRHEDDPERAVRAALDMHSYVGAHSDDFAGLGLSIGVYTGEAVYGPVGAQGSYTVLGDTVNTAARLQSAASRGEVLIGEQTARAVGDAIDLEDVPPIVAKGKQEPVLAWRAVNIKGARREVRVRTPFVGRQVEMSRLQEVWELVRTEAAPHLALVMGAPGIGKTRLLSTFLDKARRTGRVLTGRCLSFGEGITYWAIAEIIKDAAGILNDDDADTVSVKLGGLLEELGLDDLDQLRTIATAVANLVGAPRTPRGTYSAADIRVGELHWGVRRLFELLAARAPLIVVFEDLHWAEPTLLDLVASLVAGQQAPLLVLGTARSELVETEHKILEPRRERRLINLGPLDGEACAQLVSAVTGGAETTVALLAASGGNPLFLEELARAGIGDVIPDSVQALIDVRLDKLSTEERRVAGSAAVLGQRFWPSAVAHLGAADAATTIEDLVDKDIVSPVATSSLAGETEYEFRHSLLRDVAYARVPKTVRADLHRRCGEWMDQLGSGNDLVEVVAYHYEQACHLAREVGLGAVEAPVLAAVDALRRAALKADGRQGVREADGYYLRALEIIGDEMPEAAMWLRVQRVKTRTLLNDLETATAELEQVEAAARSFNMADLICNALLQRIAINVHTGKLAEAQRAIEEASKLAEQVADLKLRVRALYASSEISTILGEMDAATDAIREGLTLAEEIADIGLQVSGRMRLASAYVNMGLFDLAEPEFARAAELAVEQGTLMPQAVATVGLANVKFYTGPRDEAMRLSEQALMWFERTPNRGAQMQVLKLMARLALLRDDFVEAERVLAEARTLAGPRAPSLLVEIDRLLVAALIGQQRLEEAESAAATAFGNAQEEDPFASAEATLAGAAVAAAREQVHEAKALFGRALGLLEPLGLPVDLAEAQREAALALAKLGEEQDALALLTQAEDAFQAAGARPLIEEVQELKNRLAGGADIAPAGQT
jgi:class 3 adenylate cyclase/tetratricopeptide (TPR) repeat protein